MVKLGYSHNQSQPVQTNYFTNKPKGQILNYNC